MQFEPMKWSQFYLTISIIFVLAISSAPYAGTLTVQETDDVPFVQPMIEMVPSESFSLKAIWDDVFSQTSVSNGRNIVQQLSDNYGQRVWFPLDKNGSYQLIAAWDYMNETLKDSTGGDLEFHFMTEYLNLVAIKEGTESNLAPIIVAGSAASRYSPGANFYGSTVAAVIETARILNNYDLTNDVYFVLSNTLTGGYSGFSSGNQGLQYLINELIDDGRAPAGIIWFNPLLHNDIDATYGENLRLDWDRLDYPYDPVTYITELAPIISQQSGSNRLTVGNRSGDLFFWRMSGGYEGYRNGIPSISLGQFYLDSYASSAYDEWDVWAYDYDKIAEAVGLTASIVATLGSLGKGEAPELSFNTNLAAESTTIEGLSLTALSYVNVTVTWDKNCSVLAEIQTPTGAPVYSRNESDQSISMSYLTNTRGNFRLKLVNYGNESISVSYSYAQFQDLDWDTLDDYEEYVFGTDSLSSDTDSDLLDDPDEYALGTDPRDQDTDEDEAIDGIEILYGSDPLVQDSDGDSLLDGFEILSGYNPASNDSDGEGLSDDFELEYGTDPTSADTDRDGLDDYSEWTIQTNPLSPDSDNDGLSDLFEVLNALDPLSSDTDQDGLSDAYEVEHCLMPFDADSDRDGIPDGSDWAPREHWISVIPPIVVAVFFIGILGILASKRRAYLRGE